MSDLPQRAADPPIFHHSLFTFNLSHYEFLGKRQAVHGCRTRHHLLPTLSDGPLGPGTGRTHPLQPARTDDRTAVGRTAEHPAKAHGKRLDGRRLGPQIPEEHRAEPREGRDGLLGSRLLFAGLRKDRGPRRRQHGRPDGHGTRTGRDSALPSGRSRKHPRDDVGGRRVGAERLQHLHGLPEDDHELLGGRNLPPADLHGGDDDRPRIGGRTFRLAVAERRHAHPGCEGRGSAGVLRDVGPLLSLREVPRLEGCGRRLRRHGERPSGVGLPRHPGDRRASGQLPLGELAAAVVLSADRPPQPGAGGQHGGLPGQRSAHVVQPRRDGEPPARPLHGGLRRTRRNDALIRLSRVPAVACGGRNAPAGDPATRKHETTCRKNKDTERRWA